MSTDGNAGDDLLARMHETTSRSMTHTHWFDAHGHCIWCFETKDMRRAAIARRNRQRGKSAEAEAAEMFGGITVGIKGGPDDVRGETWLSQVKSHVGLPPVWFLVPPALRLAFPSQTRYAWVWTRYPDVGHVAVAPTRWDVIFDKMAARPLAHRLLERYAQRGVKARWWVVTQYEASDAYPHVARQVRPFVAYVVTPALDWLAEHGRDE